MRGPIAVLFKGDLIGQIRGGDSARARALPSEPSFLLRLGAALLAAGALLVGGSAPAGPLDGFASSNVEFISNIRLPHAGGGKLHDGYFYVLHANGLDIYDVSDPEVPERVGQLVAPAAHLNSSYESPDTNGKILPLSNYDFPSNLTPGRTGGEFAVIDVSDKSNPALLATLPGANTHTYTCLLECTWAYGASGQIIDLRKPANPQLYTNQWDENLRLTDAATGGGSVHDVTEVRPGRVLTASVPMFLLDTRFPVRPRVIARSDGSPYSRSSVVWPNGGRDRFVLSTGKASYQGFATPNCTLREQLAGTAFDSGFRTWDATKVKSTGLFLGEDTYFASDGIVADGNPPASEPYSGGCSARWFEPHPDFRNGGLVAAAFSGNGVKFLEVKPDGDIEEVGYWLPAHATTTMAAYWITDEIVYTLDIDRGIDILRFTDASS